MQNERSWDRTSVISLVVALVALAGFAIAVPSVLPGPLRNLVGLGPHRLAPARSADQRGAYAFLAHQVGDRAAPVGYDPCKRIALQVNLAGAPSDGMALVNAAIRQVEQATGLRFDLRGTTSRRPQWQNAYVPTVFGQARTVPDLVSWATADEVSQLSGRVAGIGGSVAVSDGGGPRRYVTGGVTLDADYYAELERTPDGSAEELAIMLHEFGHLVGLAHVHDNAELMNADNVGLLNYGPGDLAGLAKIGAVACS